RRPRVTTRPSRSKTRTTRSAVRSKNIERGGGLVPCKSGDVSRFDVVEREGGPRARTSHARDRPGRQASELPDRLRSHGLRGRSGAGNDAQRLSFARRAVSFALAALRRQWG